MLHEETKRQKQEHADRMTELVSRALEHVPADIPEEHKQAVLLLGYGNTQQATADMLGYTRPHIGKLASDYKQPIAYVRANAEIIELENLKNDARNMAEIGSVMVKQLATRVRENPKEISASDVATMYKALEGINRTLASKLDLAGNQPPARAPRVVRDLTKAPASVPERVDTSKDTGENGHNNKHAQDVPSE